MKILIADDDRSIRQSIRLTLLGEPYTILEAGDLLETYQRLTTDKPDLLLLDIHFKNTTSIELLRKLVEESIKVPTIILSGAATAGEAAEAIKCGAYDYIEKPISAERLKLTLRRCIEDAKLKRCLHTVLSQSEKKVELIGVSPAIVKIKNQIEQYGRKDIKVLITGETGVGKEVVANALWQSSERADQPFVVVNSAAIPESLMESELFGHKKGAFTGAVQDQVGKIEMADRGTLFLDEIGDLSLGAQTKLLRFLEAGEIQKIGTNRSRTVDVRLIFATSRNLEEELEKNQFRSDLFYRLNVMRIHVAPLRERKEDIPLLFSYFVDTFSRKFDGGEKLIEPEVFEILKAYPWPGNIRELRNVAERIVVVADKRIQKEHLVQIFGPNMKLMNSPTGAGTAPVDPLSLRDFKNKTEKEYIISMLKKTGGSITKAAQMLKIDRTYLHQKMSHHGISRDQIGLS